MKTYTALVAAKVGSTTKMVKTEVKAASAAEAKWLLQAIYGFHSISSSPTEMRETFANENLSHPPTPEQQSIANLKAAKDRASDALQAERDRQKKSKALKTLSSIAAN
jgi:hypothetical protein